MKVWISSAAAATLENLPTKWKRGRAIRLSTIFSSSKTLCLNYSALTATATTDKTPLRFLKLGSQFPTGAVYPSEPLQSAEHWWCWPKWRVPNAPRRWAGKPPPAFIASMHCIIVIVHLPHLPIILPIIGNLAGLFAAVFAYSAMLDA